MTREELSEFFEKHNDDFIKFERIKNPKHHAADICAFLILDEIAPIRHDVVACAEHDQIWLATDPDELASNATEEQLLDLIRCGVMLDSDTDSLSMFV